MEGNANSGEVGVGMTSSESTLAMLNRRVNEYKVAAQLANKQGDKPSALNYVRVIKVCHCHKSCIVLSNHHFRSK